MGPNNPTLLTRLKNLLAWILGYLSWYWRCLTFDNRETPSLARHIIVGGTALVGLLLVSYVGLCWFVAVTGTGVENAELIKAVSSMLGTIGSGQAIASIALYIAQKVGGGGVTSAIAPAPASTAPAAEGQIEEATL